MYGQGGGKLWYKFDEHSKLNEILVRFDCYKDDDFHLLHKNLKKDMELLLLRKIDI